MRWRSGEIRCLTYPTPQGKATPMTTTKKRIGPKPRPKPKVGRPPGKNRVQRNINLPHDLWAWVDSQQLPGETRNDCMTRLVARLRDLLSVL